MLLNLGLRADGSIPDYELAFLKDMAQWTRVGGEGIYGTRPWLVYGEIEPGQKFLFRERSHKGIVYDDPERIRMGTIRIYEGDIRYTRSKDGKTIYATRMSWPETAFTLTSFAPGNVGEHAEIRSIRLLGSDAKIQWTRTAKGIVIAPPPTPVFKNSDWPVMFKLETR